MPVMPAMADLLGPTWWRGRQWAVTSYGLECPDGRYPPIEAARLDDERLGSRGIPDWPMHMAGKSWVDADEFCAAFAVALVLHGYAHAFTPSSLRMAFEWARARRVHGETFSRVRDAMFPHHGDGLRAPTPLQLNAVADVVGPGPAEPEGE